MKNSTLVLFLFMFLMLLTGCADVQPDLSQHLVGHTYGFWGGFWHGLVANFAFIGSLISDDIAVWAINNNGGWYAFGFVLGGTGFLKIVGGLFSILVEN